MSAACHRWGVVERYYSARHYCMISKLISRHKTELAAKAWMAARGSYGNSYLSIRRLSKAERGLAPIHRRAELTGSALGRRSLDSSGRTLIPLQQKEQ